MKLFTPLLRNLALMLPLLFSVPAEAAFNPANIPAVASIAALKALGVASPQYATVFVQGYYPGNGNAGGGVFVWNGVSTASTDSCTIFQATGVSTGRWIRQFTGQLSAYDCGAKGDDSTDDTAALQALDNAAEALGVIAFYPAATYKITSTVTPGQGVRHQGVGWTIQGTAPSTVIDGTAVNSSTWCYDLELPNGTNQIEAPKFQFIWFKGCANGLRYNNPSNGFTNDGTSQEYMMHPDVEWCYFTSNLTSGIGLQLSKSFLGVVAHNSFGIGGGFATELDLEGSDHMNIQQNDIEAGATQGVLAQSHSSFGNDLVFNNNNRFIATPGGAIPLVDNYRSSKIEDNFFEPTGGNPALISLGGGFSAEIKDNVLSIASGSVTHWLTVADTSNGSTGSGYQTIDVENNSLAGNITGASVSFNSGAGIAYFANNAGSRRKITHNGNFQANGDIGFPMNALATSLDSIQYQPNVVAYYSCDTDGLNAENYGLTVMCANGAFQADSPGGSFRLFFENTDRPTPTGSLTLHVFAASASGGAVLSGCVTDNDVCVSTTANATIATKPQWYTVQAPQTVTNSGGAEIFNNTASNIISVYAIVLTD